MRNLKERDTGPCFGSSLSAVSPAFFPLQGPLMYLLWEDQEDCGRGGPEDGRSVLAGLQNLAAGAHASVLSL